MPDTHCEMCGHPKGRPHDPECIVTQFSEATRHAIDILSKWADAAVAEWGKLCAELRSVGIGTSDDLKIGEMILITSCDFRVIVEGHQLSLVGSLKIEGFDANNIPKIRILVEKAFNEIRKKISNRKQEIKTAAEQKIKKINTVLPAVVDEFGADIMKYEPAKSPKKPGDPLFP
ncbi:MAG: hypothetical protein EHM36_00095 [Deltaproteobacteria bacterium]|nr:MAG: hypothetical protein EHM36_00095 [Deltaproteobacteria bacterium]